MRLISYRKDGNVGISVMIDESNFVSSSATKLNLPVKMMELLNQERGIEVARVATEGKDADLSLGDMQLLPLIPDTPVI